MSLKIYIFFFVVCALCVPAIFLWQEFVLCGRWGFPLDDTWIHLQFARNIWESGRFAFNSGESLAGSTAPLWSLFLAIVYGLFDDVVWPTKIVGLLLLWSTGFLTFLMLRDMGASKFWGLLGGGVVVITPRLVWGSLSGMEVMLYTTLSTAGIWCHIRSWHYKPSFWGTVCFALATLARPECVMLFPLALIDRWCKEKNLYMIGKLYWKHCIVFVLLILPSVLFSLYTLGKPLPNTFYAKVGSYGLLGALVEGNFVRVAKVVFFYPLLQMKEVAQFGLENNFFLTCLIPLGLLRLFKQESSSTSLLIPFSLLAFPVLKGMLAPFQGALFQHGRYAAHLVPLMTVVGVWGVGLIKMLLEDRLQALRIMRWRHSLFCVGVLGSLLVINLRYAPLYGQDVENIQHMHVKMGNWLAQNTPKGAIIATHDIGAIGYFSGRKILDTVGLVTPEILPFLRKYPSIDQGVWAFLKEKKPDYVVLVPNWYDKLAYQEDKLKPIYEVTLKKVSIAAGQRMVVYRPVWSE